jgi:hypothetical protein
MSLNVNSGNDDQMLRSRFNLAGHLAAFFIEDFRLPVIFNSLSIVFSPRGAKNDTL